MPRKRQNRTRTKPLKWTAFIALDFFPKRHLARRRAIIEHACADFGFHAIFGERKGLDKGGGSAAEFLEGTREVIAAADVTIFDVTGYSRRSRSVPKVDGLNLNVLLELGISYGAQKHTTEVLCDAKCRDEIRLRVTNLGGRSPTFLYYDGLLEFRDNIRALLERRARALQLEPPFAELARKPHSTFTHESGFRVKYPHGWELIEDDKFHFRLIPGTGGSIINGTFLPSPVIEDVHDIAQFGTRRENIEAVGPIRFLSHAAHSPWTGKATLRYRKLPVKPPADAQTDFKRGVSSWRHLRSGRASASIVHYCESILNSTVLALEISCDNDLRDRSELLLSLVSGQVITFYPGEDRTEELVRVRNLAVGVKFRVLEEHGEPGEFFEVQVLFNDRPILSILDFVGVKIPQKLRRDNDVRSDYILVRACGDDTWLILLFGYQYASSPGEVAVISITRQEVKICMRRSLEISELAVGPTPANFRLIGFHAYAEGLGEKASTYDPPSVYGLQRGNLVLLESETIKLARKYLGGFKGFESSTKWKVIREKDCKPRIEGRSGSK